MNETMKKVFVLVPPADGHLNPMCSLVHELVKEGVQIVFYANDEHRRVIENTGAQFRPYSHPNLAEFQRNQINKQLLSDDSRLLYTTLKCQMDYSYQLLPSLMQDLDSYQPDLILYDQMFLPAKYLVEMVKQRPQPPKTVQFHPSMAMNQHTFDKYRHLMRANFISFIYYMFVLFLKQLIFDLHFGLKVIHRLQLFTGYKDRLNIVAVLEKFQPERNTFDETYKFVGPCIRENVRNFDFENPKLTSILHDKSNISLIYVSLGTFFNDCVDILEDIIKAFEIFRQKFESKMVISVGNGVYDKLLLHLNEQNYQLPDQLYLFPKVPQIEILKRASLFVTHAGQNSASETIQYAVPVVCIPIVGDQPTVAWRMCEELKVGIRLDRFKLKPIMLANAMEEIFINPIYRHNMSEISNMSTTNQDGVRNSTKLILEFLKK